MTSKKTTIKFPKELFTRAKNDDFYDDGTKFSVYYYKGIMRVTYARLKLDDGTIMVFLSPSHYISSKKLNGEEMADMLSVASEFNGVEISQFDMTKFISNCDELMEKYHVYH